MPSQPEWEIFKSYTSPHEQLVSLWRILKFRGSGRNQWIPRANDQHAIDLSAQLPLQLGELTPRINMRRREIIVTCERGSPSGAETFEIAKVVFIPKEKQTKVLVSPVIQDDAEINKALRDVCERPLWYFISNCGTRGSCVFCPKPLTHQSSRNVGYGPDCAKQMSLYYKYDGPETKRMSSFGVSDDFDYDSL